MPKRRVLFVGEASYLGTGFSTYWNEVISRIHATDEFEIAEFGSYANDNDPRNAGVPWKFYPNAPDPSDQAANQIYHSCVTNQFGEWRFADVCLSFRPDVVCDIRDFWMCFGANTPIVMSDGTPKRIQEVKTGDQVLSHTGTPRRVVHTFSRFYGGRLHTIKPTHCVIPIEVTSNHPVLVHPRDKAKSLNRRWSSSRLAWKQVADLTTEDFLCFPLSHVRRDVDFLSKDLCRILGYYAANGCLMYEGRREKGVPKGVQFAFNADDTDLVNDVVEIAQNRLGRTPSVKRSGRSYLIVVRVFGREWFDFCSDYVGEHAHNKRLHPSVYALPDDKIAHLLHGIFRCDGCLKTGVRGSYNTVSPCLAYQVFQLCARLGVVPSMGYNKNNDGVSPKIRYRYIYNFSSRSLRGFESIYLARQVPQERDTTRLNDEYVFLTIRSLQDRQVEKVPVYNFEVEGDNSYLTSFAAHNCEYQLRHPYRPYYTLIHMPTVDGLPQKPMWIDAYRQADYVLTYSQWAFDILRRAGDINMISVASPGADLDVFKPVPDKAAHKKQFGLSQDSFIVGSVMRNQRRKLYYDLIEAFAQWIRCSKHRGHLDRVKNAWLYLHTSFPDVGYDIGRAVQECGVADKVLMTYACMNCGIVYPHRFAGEIMHCPQCRHPSAHPPNPNHPIPRNVLATIVNLFDVYVQYSICEGWGLPVTEAMACGVPCMAVNYSAMEDHCKMPGGIPIKVERFFHEPVIETEQRRALPDNADLVEKLDEFIRMSVEQRADLARRTRAYIEEPAEVWGQEAKLPRFGWERPAAIWANVIRAAKLPAASWSDPVPKIFKSPGRSPGRPLNNAEFVHWCLTNILGRPDLVDSFMATEWIKWLNCGYRVDGPNRVPLDRAGLMQMFEGMSRAKNELETRRVAGLSPAAEFTIL